ncbi:MAG: GTPase, partial [Coleofasciculus sp. C2-GNP5-27]
MVQLKRWQWIVLAMPIISIMIFILVSAGWQIHEWGINWIWGIFILIFAGWRWLLVKWTRSTVDQVEAAVVEVSDQLDTTTEETTALPVTDEATQNAEAALQTVLKQAQDDPPMWEDWQQFWQRCQELVIAIAHIYQPEAKYPLLNIYIPQAYGLMRGTVDDLDQWMQKLSPALNQVTVGQGLQAYEVYQKLEPSARKLWQAWSWAQWVINPVAALARQASQRSSNQATQQLLVNLGQMLREAALKNLSRQAIALYSGSTPPSSTTVSPPKPQLPQA